MTSVDVFINVHLHRITLHFTSPHVRFIKQELHLPPSSSLHRNIPSINIVFLHFSTSQIHYFIVNVEFTPSKRFVLLPYTFNWLYHFVPSVDLRIHSLYNIVPSYATMYLHRPGLNLQLPPPHTFGLTTVCLHLPYYTFICHIIPSFTSLYLHFITSYVHLTRPEMRQVEFLLKKIRGEMLEINKPRFPNLIIQAMSQPIRKSSSQRQQSSCQMETDLDRMSTRPTDRPTRLPACLSVCSSRCSHGTVPSA